MLVNKQDVSGWFKEVSVPYWAKTYSTYSCRAYQCVSTIFKEFFVLEYSSKFIFDNSFIILCIRLDNHMFGGMNGIWKEIANKFMIGIDDDGRIFNYDLYKIEQSDGGLPRLIYSLYELYKDWKPYENIGDYDIMMKVKKSNDAIGRLKHELKNKGIENEMEKTRREISELRESLINLENAMTKLYEDAAEAMNFLEEHGYPHEELT